MSEKKEKTCRKCGHKYTGRYCKNKNCVANATGKAKARAAARRRSGSKGKSMHFGQLSVPVMPAAAPLSGQGGTLPVNPDAVPQTEPDPRQETIARANQDDAYFMALCFEDAMGRQALQDELDYFRQGY